MYPPTVDDLATIIRTRALDTINEDRYDAAVERIGQPPSCYEKRAGWLAKFRPIN